MRKTLLPFLILCCLPGILYAQQAPLSRLHVQADAVAPLYVSYPFDYFKPVGIAPRLLFGANYFNGEITLGVTFNRFNSDTMPYFHSTLFVLGYRYNFPLGKNAWLKPGAGFGNHHMRFGNVKGNKAHINESELLLEASLALQLRLYRQLHVSGSAVFQRTMLHHRFDQLSTCLSLLYYFDSPAILKKVLE